MKQFIKGQKAKLASLTGLMTFEVGVQLTFASPQAVDISCFGVDIDDQLSDDRYFIFYNQPSSPDGSLRMLGAQGGDDQRFRVDLAGLPQRIRKLVFTATLDNQGTMAQVKEGYLRLLANGAEVVRYSFTGADFQQEKAILLGEVYLKGVWRFGAVGQGFNGGLSALLEHFGGEEISEPALPAAAPVKEVPVPPPPPSKSVSLEKRLEREAPQLVSLVKKATVSLKKAGLEEHRAKVALCLDISASMNQLYKSGKIQRFAERILALGCKFDEDGSIDIFLFGREAHQANSMTIGNFKRYVPELIREYPLEGGTYYGKVVQMIRGFYFPETKGRRTKSPISANLPIYVMFVTDGDTFDPAVTKQQMRDASFEPIFWQFMAIGKSKKDTKGFGRFFQSASSSSSGFSFLEQLDSMSGRYLDNADFFSVEDPQNLSDDQLYDLLMTEYPKWVKAAQTKRLLK
ncbi:MAG: VWA domain-containing protein [Ardenticatenaceae bacterium]